MIEWIEGSYTNVVGLPLCQLIRLFKEAGILDIFEVPMASPPGPSP
jgi:predicted house-cleaning NTP pyrophosphatase (Maf/HAM1 superfamily)